MSSSLETISDLDLGKEIASLIRRVLSFEQSHSAPVAVPEKHRASYQNFIHWLALRSVDLIALQHHLSDKALSSLGRSDGCVLDTLVKLYQRLIPPDKRDPTLLGIERNIPVSFSESARLAESNVAALFGPERAERATRIMVTASAGVTCESLKAYLLNGMDSLRINCAHDSPEDWKAIAEKLRESEQELYGASGRCQILCDLAGPKIRVSWICPVNQVFSWDLREAAKEPGKRTRIWLSKGTANKLQASLTLCVEPSVGSAFALLQPGDTIFYLDQRKGKERKFSVTSATPEGCLVSGRKRGALQLGAVLRVERQQRIIAELTVLPPPSDLQSCELKVGDRVVLVPADSTYAHRGSQELLATIGCSVAEVFEKAQLEQPVVFDDGCLNAKITRISSQQHPREIEVLITEAIKDKVRLRAEKGIAFPECRLAESGLTLSDREHLRAVASFADCIGLSFAQGPDDVHEAILAMRAAGMQDKGLSIKIETRSAFDALAAIILATLEWPKCGIMIARGDGRVHWGDLRLAEIQNEITWACAAAHCPVIWATGVLEELSKRGVVRNAEITDAHKGIDHANCVMLNKGSYVERSITLLADLARVVRRHASGKYPLLGPLSMAKRYTQ